MLINTRLRWNSDNKESYGTYVARKIKKHRIIDYRISQKGRKVTYYMSEEDWEKIMGDLK